MPIFEYECKSCGNIDAPIQKVKETNHTCSKCGGDSNPLVSLNASRPFHWSRI